MYTFYAMGRTGNRIAASLAATIAIPAILSGCAGAVLGPGSYFAAYGLSPEPRPAAFDVCRNIGCTETVRVSLDGPEWALVQALFSPPPADGRDERARAARAVGTIEELAGPKAGTMHDAARNGPGPPGTFQLDCVAEASNATVYLSMLERDGLLPLHRVGYPARRGFLFLLQHNAAVLVERATGTAWAVDSWHGPNGSPADVWPLELWRARKENAGNRENRVAGEKNP